MTSSIVALGFRAELSIVAILRSRARVNFVRQLIGILGSMKKAPPRSASTGGRVIYAVGDIHGCAGLLNQLIGLISIDFIRTADQRPGIIVFLGDYIDRGDDSRAVIDFILSLQQRRDFETVCLKGNHEQALLQFLDEPRVGPKWVQFGGGATLAAYGVTPPSVLAGTELWSRARDALISAMPDAHLGFLRSLQTTLTIGDFMFVHAGVRRGVSLDQQSEHDMLWIRRPFLNENRPFDKIIVYGHTPTDRPFSGPNRIGVDTGAYASGILTAVRLDDGGRTFIST